MSKTTDPTRRDVLASGAALAAGAAAPSLATARAWPLPDRTVTLTFEVAAGPCARAT